MCNQNLNSRQIDRFINFFDDKGIGHFMPFYCRKNLIAAEKHISSLKTEYLRFVEIPLLGKSTIDMTWMVKRKDILESKEIPLGLDGARKLAPLLDKKSIFFVEYDTSKPMMPMPSFYYEGVLENGDHAIGKMADCIGMGNESHDILMLVDKLVSLGYVSRTCGVMAGRSDSHVRISAMPLGEFNADRLLNDLKILGFPLPKNETYEQIQKICIKNEYMFSAPLIYLDVLPNGTLGDTLGIELCGIRASNIDVYPQLKLAQEWGLADDRWKALRDVSATNADELPFLFINTIKFRWRKDEALPVKLYLKTSW